MSRQRLCHLGFFAFVLALLSVAAPQPTQAQESFGQRLGEQLDQGLERFRNEVREGWESLRSTVDKMGVQARVYSRLRWDKKLADSEIDVDIADGGVVTLRGRVSDAAAKQKAIQLATDTVGVTRVAQELTVVPPGESPRGAEQPAETLPNE